MKKLILGTAGHIDHGKTALVKALTGIDTDRLPEEKLRGITIDLGFANLRIGDVSFGIVDVPGHEGFIHNMLAGATGIDVVMIVVAADEGVMPQTREHIAIMDLLGVEAGIVAITKTDLVTEEWTDLVAEEIRQTLSSTSLAHAPIVPVSIVSGAGIEDLRQAIAQQSGQPTARQPDDLFRMPVDRVFTVRGTGTVVTGTVWSGSVDVDDAITLLPHGKQARVRGIEIHGEAVVRASAGERAAIAVSGVDTHTVTRGAVAVGNLDWPTVQMLTVFARVLPDSSWQLKTRQRVRVHLGTEVALARVAVIEATSLEPGDNGWVQLRLETPLVARTGDRLIIRSYSPVTTIGGGIVAELGGRKRREVSVEEISSLRQIIAGSPGDAVGGVLAMRGARGAQSIELSFLTPYSPRVIEAAIEQMGKRVVRVQGRLFSGDVVQATIAALLRAADHLHARYRLRPGIPRAELRMALPGVASELVEHALAAAILAGGLSVDGSNVAMGGHTPRLTSKDVALKQQVRAAIANAGLAPPTLAELERELGAAGDLPDLLRLLEAEGAIRALTPDLYIDEETLKQALAKTRMELADGRRMAAADFRAALPVTRKHLIPLLEYFDRTGVTAREGDLRTVLPASESG